MGGRAAFGCAAVAVLVALAWSIITPPFQVPDEPTHFAYVQQLAETGHPPGRAGRPPLSSELQQALDASRFSEVIGNPHGEPPWPGAPAAALHAQLARSPARDDGGGPSNTSNQPPLYYALGVVPYRIADALGADVLQRVQAGRLLSVLLCGLTVLFVFSFLTDLLPGTPLAAPAGALAVALQPMFGFVGSGVHADSLMFAVAAALFAALARAFRRGLTTRRAAAIGLAIALGLLTKLTFVGVVPGALLGLAVLWWRLPRAERARPALAAGAAVVAPLAVYVALDRFAWDRALYATETSSVVATQGGRPASVRGALSYALQFYFGRLPFLRDQIPGGYAVFDIWFKQLVGRFGWVDYSFPGWVTWAALGIWGALLALGGRALAVAGRALRPRLAELLTYVAMTVGLLVVIALPAYSYRLGTSFTFEQIRYLFPLLALYGALIGLAVRGAGARWGPVVAGSVVGLAAVHCAFAMLLTVGRYYG